MNLIIKHFSFTIAYFLIALLTGVNTFAQTHYQQGHGQAYSAYSDQAALAQIDWVEQTLSRMSIEEKIGQLFMIAAYTNRDDAHRQEIARIIDQHHIGGLIFFQDNAIRQVEHTNFYQQKSKVPLLISIDGEWGLSMRLKKTPRYPKQLTLGALQDDRLVYEMGRDIARQCKRMGIHVNLAPVVDVNNNPMNPVINDRSFGEDKYNVTRKGIAYMQGMEENGIIACAKHFPGHGDTDADSHQTLPVIRHDKGRLYDVELYPFQQMAAQGIGGMMIAHLAVPALDDSPLKPGSNLSIPTTLSKKVVTDLLKNEMGYRGLVFTDALNMKGVSSHFPPGIVDVKALLAGNDVLLFSQDVGRAVSEIKQAIAKGEITEQAITERARKILRAKVQVNAHQFQPISTNNLMEDLNSKETELLKIKLVKNAITVARNDRGTVPLNQLQGNKIATLAIGSGKMTTFQTYADKYAPMSHHTLRHSDSQTAFDQKYELLRQANTVLISIHAMSKSAKKNYGLDAKSIALIDRLSRETNVVLTVFGSPYSLKNFNDQQTVICAYEENTLTQKYTPQIIFGALPARGRLPVTASPSFRFGQGYDTPGNMRLQYTIPEDSGLRNIDLDQIDRVVQEAINIQATPGCQVLVAKDGKVIYEKAFGKHTYTGGTMVHPLDLYDIASITKVAGTALGLMDMYDNGRLNLDGKLGDHLPFTQGTNKQNLVLRDILLHEAGLESWIPFYKETIPALSSIYKAAPSTTHSIKVADRMFMRDDYVQTLWRTLLDSNLPNRSYRYSDLGFYLFKEVIQTYAQQPLPEYLNQRFYHPLGLSTLGFNPRDRFSTRSIVPTENDKDWRKQLVHGHVHDMGAAMLGGVGGHAGLFSNANDLAIIGQMLLNGGVYGGIRYINEGTIQEFTRQQRNNNRRGLAFDKPEKDTRKIKNCSDFTPASTFGHTGFTGTCMWLDPENDLIYIFLSNRVYPSSRNNKLLSKDIRPRIQDAIYMAVNNGKRTINQY